MADTHYKRRRSLRVIKQANAVLTQIRGYPNNEHEPAQQTGVVNTVRASWTTIHRRGFSRQ